jgi:hypothetical protein
MGSIRFAVVALAALLPQVGTATTISFDSLAVGAVVTNQFPGVEVSLLGAKIAGPRTYALEDTNGVPQFIFGASGNAITPGDNVGGINAPFYDFEFQFGNRIDYFSLMVLDAEEAVSASAFLGGVLVGSPSNQTFLGFNSATVFNGPVYQIELGAVGGPLQFDRVRISLNAGDGPELFDNLSFNSVAVVPEPSSYLLLIAGLALLGWPIRWGRT